MIEFDDRAEAAYELVLDHPGCSLAELTAHWTGEDLADVLRRLVTHGFVLRDDDGRHSALPPDIAADVLFGEHELELRRMREYIARLTAGPGHGPHARTPFVELVTGLPEVRRRLLHARHAAQHRVRCLDWRFPAGTAPHVELFARGVECFALYDHGSVNVPGVVAEISARADAGEQARALPSLPLRAYLVDDHTAMIPLRRGTASLDSAVFLRPSVLLDVLHKLFDTLWQRAIPLRLASGPASVESAEPNDPENQRLVSLMLSGLTTAAIARQLRVSERTAQRRVTALMADLGATTRFQAGVQAALRGLAPPPSR